jgi:folate-binding protein YgfZ
MSSYAMPRTSDGPRRLVKGGGGGHGRRTMIETPLRAHLAALGAVYGGDRGVALPQRFGDPAGEYAALRERVAVVDLGFRTLVRAVGPDRASFLQGMLTNDVASLAPGGGCAALLLTIQGRVTADVRVAALDDAFLLDVDVRVREGFVQALEALVIADEVEFGPPPAAVALLGLEGPGAAALLGAEAGALAPWAHAAVTIAGVACRAVRASEVRGPGFVLHAPAADAIRVWDALVGAGARPAGMEALEGRRIEVGVPRIGLDMDGSTLALEVPVDDAISGTKGCYLGQEVVARGTARGHVNRRLTGLLLDGPAPPSGAPLVREGKEVGRLTSVAHAFGAETHGALGFVRREHWEPGTQLAVKHGHAVTLARVAALPLA